MVQRWHKAIIMSNQNRAEAKTRRNPRCSGWNWVVLNTVITTTVKPLVTHTPQWTAWATSGLWTIFGN